MMITTNLPEYLPVAVAALKQVIDPEIGLNIVDLGLVYRVDFQLVAKKIKVEMTLTSQFCPMGEAITDSAHEAMQDAFAGYTTEIELVFAPRWGHHMISEEGLAFLNE